MGVRQQPMVSLAALPIGLLALARPGFLRMASVGGLLLWAGVTRASRALAGRTVLDEDVIELTSPSWSEHRVVVLDNGDELFYQVHVDVTDPALETCIMQAADPLLSSIDEYLPCADPACASGSVPPSS